METWRLIIMFKTPHNPSLSCTVHILSMPSHPVFLRFILISPSLLHLSLPSGRQPTHGLYSVSFTEIHLCLVTRRLVKISVDLLAWTWKWWTRKCIRTAEYQWDTTCKAAALTCLKLWMWKGISVLLHVLSADDMTNLQWQQGSILYKFICLHLQLRHLSSQLMQLIFPSHHLRHWLQFVRYDHQEQLVMVSINPSTKF